MRTSLHALVWPSCFTVLVGCSKQDSNSVPDPILGKWQISNIIPASLEGDSTLTVNEALALFLMDGEMRPAILTVAKNDLTLHTEGGDSEVLTYTIMDAEDDHYMFKTKEGDAEFVIESAKKAHFMIGGATYELYR